jgi:uncharacterized protein (TIGR03086 family)
LDVLEETLQHEHVSLDARGSRHSGGEDPAGSFSERARRILEVLPGPTRRQGVTTLGDRRLPIEVVLLTLALEIAVHAWDISRARGERRPIPSSLALELSLTVPLLLDDATRPGLFAKPVPVPAGTSPGDRLVAYLGRDPAA